MGAKTLYGVYKDDELVFKGRNQDIADFLCIEPASIRTYVTRNTLSRGMYRIKILGKYETKAKPKPSPKQIEHEKHLENIIAMLRVHGQTFVRKPEEWRKEINDAGIQFRCVPFENGYTLERI